MKTINISTFKNLFFISVIVFFNSSCRKEINLEHPVSDSKLSTSVKKRNGSDLMELKSQINKLRKQVENIDVTETTKNLPKQEKLRFTNRLSDLKIELNKAIRLIKNDESLDNKTKARSSLNRAMVIWDYMLMHYKI